MTTTIDVNYNNTFTVVIDDNLYINATVTSSGEDVDDWISNILHIHRRRLNNLYVGLDVEWRPTFGRNVNNPVAVLQLCVGCRCLVFQLLHANFIPQSLADFLDDERFRFFGVGIEKDAEKLSRDWNLDVRNCVDLRELAEEVMDGVDARQMGLKALASLVMDLEIDKPRRVQTSRWDAECLTYDQIMYATVDACLSFQIGKSLFDDLP